MKNLVAALLATIPACLLGAQTPGKTAVRSSDGMLGPSCPIGFSASRTGALTGLLASRSGEVRSGAGFHLDFVAMPGSRLSFARVIVHAAGAGGRVLPAGSSVLPVSPESPAEFTRSFDVGSAEGPGLTKADLWLADAGVLESAEVVSLTFRDGSRWHRSSDHRCIAEPSPLMLVGVHTQQR